MKAQNELKQLFEAVLVKQTAAVIFFVTIYENFIVWNNAEHNILTKEFLSFHSSLQS